MKRSLPHRLRAALGAAAIAMTALILSACRTGPDYAPPRPAGLADTGSAFRRAADLSTEAPVARWWQQLGDAHLDSLVDRALRRSPSIAAARAAVAQARADSARARADLLPTLSATTGYIYADLPSRGGGEDRTRFEYVTQAFDAAWEIDLWGGKARAAERARADAAAVQARLEDAQVALSAEIVRTYVALRARQASLLLVDRRIALESRIGDLESRRAAAGTGTRIAVERAARTLIASRAERAALDADRMVLRDALATLVGDGPGTLDDLPDGSVPLPPATVAVGDPATMLARRPDLKAAERMLAAATAQIGVEQARRLPNISLTGLIGIGGTGLDDAFDPPRLAAVALPRLSWSFLDFGRSAARVRGAKAGRDVALARYQAAVLAALQDAEAALTRYGAARALLGHAVADRAAATRLSGLQSMRAKAGTIAQKDALEDERQALDAGLAQVNRQAEMTIAYAALAKALGLGWMADDGAPKDGAAS